MHRHIQIPFPLRFLLGTFVFAALGVFLLYGVDYWIDRHARSAAADVGLTINQSNTAKHAFAAGKVFFLLRGIGLGEETSKEWVYKLGIFNEWLEYYTQPSDTRDWTAEIMKDLFNNLCGVQVAIVWSKEAKNPSTDEYMHHLAMLTKSGVLPHDWRDSRIPYKDYKFSSRDADPAAAVAWFRHDQKSLEDSIQEKIKISHE
ncbi:MAG: hypothetical protein EB060_03145 [Proteobacteria bacterium]|nr:hypothetical protein [Pseudomonadota bacterium]